MPIPEPALTGTVAFRGWQTWYRITGDPEPAKTPLVVLHGGPGAAHDYTLRIAALAGQGRTVIHYDQLGIGNSTHLPGKGADFWTVQLFLDELDNLLAGLGLAGGYHVLGQSWGGMLAAEHAVRRPPGLKALVIANSPASMELWLSEAARLRALLPPEVQKTLREHEEAGTTGHPDYKAAEAVFNARHVCRIVPNPPEVAATFAAIDADPTVYHTMNGPNEFHVIGTLKDWTIIDRADRIAVPTLLVSGRHDEATEATVRPYADRIPDVRWKIFEDSSHMPHVEEEEAYLRLVGAFLDEND
ncbi:proline iminopeptidase-family hydrolase [Nonomuraea basaltis]|uniref:proline iminopeptidase-family hydrolase n=1 Tax=Nonomuraea basaltis TaxID=2495887 RepID=UPI00110C489F|nr:proline iminopeptidase-family hydrolase [Nonomuraea basaltis]TMR99900.1 alpha/beta fold hydrolase [Nonomuraea basaltis]